MRTVAAAAAIDISALKHNLRCVRDAAPNANVMAVIKASAYGHDPAIIAAGLSSADALAVARVEEGVALRQRGFQRRVVVLEGAVSTAEVAVAAQFRLDLVVHQLQQIDLLARFSGVGKFNIWLKLDTGMHRLGIAKEDFSAAVARLQKMPNVVRPISVMTHLANADLRSDPMTPQQIKVFDSTIGAWPGDVSIANSAGLLAWPDSRRDWVRPGIMLYGISPFADQTGADLGLRPVMHYQSRLMAVRAVPAGGRVGYGATWTAATATWVGTVSTGYGDGYPGNMPSGTPVLVNGKRLPLVGRVSMDMLAIDLGSEPTAKIGDTVTLWGPGLPVEEIASHSGRISYELVCGIARRVPRLLLETDS